VKANVYAVATLCVKAGVVRGVAFVVCKSQCEHGWCSEPCDALCVKAGVSAMANSCTVCQSRCVRGVACVVCVKANASTVGVWSLALHCVSKPVLFVESLALCVKANASTVGVWSLA